MSCPLVTAQVPAAATAGQCFGLHHDCMSAPFVSNFRNKPNVTSCQCEIFIWEIHGREFCMETRLNIMGILVCPPGSVGIWIYSYERIEKKLKLKLEIVYWYVTVSGGGH